MWIQVRSMDGRRSVRVDNLSKLTHIEELRERLVEHFQAEPERQRLFYRGKQVWVCRGGWGHGRVVGGVGRARFTRTDVWLGCQTRLVPSYRVSELRLIEQVLSARDGN